MHSLINSQKTGTPETFAKQLDLSRRQMYNQLEFFKTLNAKIKYCKKKETFYYSSKFEFSFSYSLVAISDEESIKISGGLCFNTITFNVFL
jgi:transcriptional antiterminator